MYANLDGVVVDRHVECGAAAGPVAAPGVAAANRVFLIPITLFTYSSTFRNIHKRPPNLANPTTNRVPLSTDPHSRHISTGTVKRGAGLQSIPSKRTIRQNQQFVIVGVTKRRVRVVSSLGAGAAHVISARYESTPVSMAIRVCVCCESRFFARFSM